MGATTEKRMGEKQRIICSPILFLSSEQTAATHPQVSNCIEVCRGQHVHNIGRGLAVQSLDS